MWPRKWKNWEKTLGNQSCCWLGCCPMTMRQVSYNCAWCSEVGWPAECKMHKASASDQPSKTHAKWLGPSLTWNNIQKEILTDPSCLTKWFSQVHTDENISEELTLKLGVEHGWGFSSWSTSIESSDSMICEWCFQVTQIRSSKGKRNNLFFCELNIGKIYFLKFFANYFHQNPDVSSETQLTTSRIPCQMRISLPVYPWQGNPPLG